MNEEMETVFQDEVIDHVDEQEVDQVDHVEQSEESQSSEKNVPLFALQKERKKAQEERQRREEVEKLLAYERQQRMQDKPQEEDTSMYETVTRQELKGSNAEVVRHVVESLWVKDNPEKYEKVNEHLPNFLKQRPHLAIALKQAPNRYEEAYILMEALSPKEKKILTKPAAKEARQSPGSPSGVPKGAALNETVDVMTMSDAEFATWRSQQRRR